MSEIDLESIKQQIYNTIDKKSEITREIPLNGYHVVFSIIDDALHVRTEVIVSDITLSSSIASYLTDFIKKSFPRIPSRSHLDGISIRKDDITQDEFLSSIPSLEAVSNLNNSTPIKVKGRYHILVSCSSDEVNKFAANYSLNERKNHYMSASINIKFGNFIKQRDIFYNENNIENRSKEIIEDESTLKDNIVSFMKAAVDKLIDFSFNVRCLTILDPLSSKPLTVIKYLNEVIECSDITEIVLLYLLNPQYITKY